MSCYISSNENRFYVQSELEYATVEPITEANRFPAVKLGARCTRDRVNRRDKVGGRTFRGLPTGLRTRSDFRLQTYLTTWSDVSAQPCYGPLFAAVTGGDGLIFSGATVGTAQGTTLTFASPHGLEPQQAVAYGGELRFVAAVQDGLTVELNAPFSEDPGPGSDLSATLTYKLGDLPKSISVFDYWGPAGAVHRVLSGAVVDELKMTVNGDFHEFEFSGPAADVIDSATFVQGQGGLDEFPEEPALAPFDYSIVPGHLGQVWIGASPERLHTLSSASVALKNNVDLRADEFGRQSPVCFIAGTREVSLNFSLYERDDSTTRGLYQAARQRTPVSVMFQLGEQSGQLFGLHVQSVTPEIPEFDDSDTRLQWKFSNCRAEGTGNDEIVLAFA